MLPKPRIRPYFAFYDRKKEFICISEMAAGIGETPLEAYQNWLSILNSKYRLSSA